MKCTRLEDWYEQHGDDSSAPGWHDRLSHARTCADCGTVMANRAVMLEALREMPAPVPPRDLVAQIGQVLDLETGENDDPASASTLVDTMIEQWLRPVQYALAAACLVTVISIGLPDFNRQIPVHKPAAPTRAAGHPAVARSLPVAAPAGLETSVPPVSGQALAKLSEADVAAFMGKLNAYRRSHPEIDDQRAVSPVGILAADR